MSSPLRCGVSQSAATDCLTGQRVVVQDARDCEQQSLAYASSHCGIRPYPERRDRSQGRLLSWQGDSYRGRIRSGILPLLYGVAQSGNRNLQHFMAVQVEPTVLSSFPAITRPFSETEADLPGDDAPRPVP